MKNTDLRAKARAIFGPAIAEPMPKQPNGAKALQQRANARPIPTYKVGGVVKKPMPTPADLAASKAQNEMLKKEKVSKEDAARFATGNRNSRLTGEEMKKMKMAMGGKVQTSSDTARKLATEMGGYKKGGKVKDVEVDMKGLEEMSRPRAPLPNLESRVAEARSVNTARAKETSDAAKKQSFKEAFAEAREKQGPNGVFTWRGNAYNTKMAGESPKAGRAAAAPSRGDTPAAAPAVSNRGNPPAAATGTPAAPAAAQTGSGTPPASTTVKPARAAAPVRPQVGLRNTDLGSYFADILDKERAANAASNKKLVERYKSEGRPRLAKIVSMLSGAEYAKGGKVKAEKTKEAKPKNGLAVMIAIGKPMKPAKKMNGGPMASGSKDMEASKVTRDMAMGGAPMGYAAGGAGKMRKGMMPEKFAQGGAGKVRKGMMTPEGNIIKAMNKMRGK
jgi:hypothetical protein